MKRTKLALVCLAVVAGLGALVTAATQFVHAPASNQPDLQDMLGTPKTEMQLRLYGANRDPKTGESKSALSVGHDVFSDNGKTKLLSLNQYVSGAAEDVHYRADGSKHWSRDYFPNYSAGTAVQRSVSWFASDGKTYTGHEVKRADGSWERVGHLLDSGNYQQTYYCADGKTPQKIQLFDKDKRFLNEQAVFCTTGKSVREITTGEYGKKTLKLYHQDGTLAADISQQDDYEVVMYSGDVYDDNGKQTAHYDHEYGMGGSISTFDQIENGITVIEWRGSDYGNAQVDFLLPASTKDEKLKRFTQGIKNPIYPDKNSKLLSVTEYEADGKTEAREIYLGDDGITPNKITKQISTDLLLTYTLDADGRKIVKASVRSYLKKTEVEQALPADVNVKIPAEELKLVEHADEPKWDDGQTDTGNKLYDFP